MTDELLDLQVRWSERCFRATGRSTRLVDKYVQDLYDKKGEWLLVQDHYPSRKACEFLCGRILKRMQSEHPMDTVGVRRDGVNIYIRLESSSRDEIERDLNDIAERIRQLKK